MNTSRAELGSDQTGGEEMGSSWSVLSCRGWAERTLLGAPHPLLKPSEMWAEGGCGAVLCLLAVLPSHAGNSRFGTSKFGSFGVNGGEGGAQRFSLSRSIVGSKSSRL